MAVAERTNRTKATDRMRGNYDRPEAVANSRGAGAPALARLATLAVRN